jgi:hypothetical protein
VISLLLFGPSMLGDDFGPLASIFSAAASTAGKLGSAAITADAQETAARESASAQTALAVSRGTLDLALARLQAAQSARTSEQITYALSLGGLLLALALGLTVLA